MQRKLISLVTSCAFLGLLLTSAVLYCTPEGRVAYWADWTFLSLSKTQWSQLHITGGMLFLLSGLWHMCLNWKPIVHYLKKGFVEHSKTPVPALVALGLTLFVYAGTLWGLPPMKQIITWNEAVKSYHANTYGNPPYPHAELSSLEQFCGFLRIDTQQTVTYLQQQNMQGDITPTTTVLAIAKANNIPPQTVYGLIRKAAGGDNPLTTLPETPPEGTGKQPLSVFCAQNDVPYALAEKKLNTYGIATTPEKTFSQMAAENNMKPRDVYNLLRKE